MKKHFIDLKRHLLTGTSHMIPFVVAGGIIFSISIMLNKSAQIPTTGILGDISRIGLAGLNLFIPVLGAYIAFSIADRPGLAPGMIGAYLAQEVQAGFLGGIIAGFIAGIVVKQLKKIELPTTLKSIGTIFLYPLGGTLITGGIVIWGIGAPIAWIMQCLTNWLAQLSDIGKIPLGMILGGMTAFDMGGPINKVATLFAQTQVDSLPYLMGGVGVAICVPPLGLGLATLLAPHKYSDDERQAGKGALLMGCVGITEGAIPFAANDPLRVIPSIVIGAIIGNVSAFLFGVLNHAPWGGLIVLPIVENRLGYIFSVLIGAIVTALLVNFLKSKKIDRKIVEDDFEIEFEQL
ncbi:PTS fructose transporter subunit EIIC [Candidatus Stoquefichus sp. SB1]|uniref:PTS fructose transporter subunit EIIC n=1 Tax=Candidatus Stoquefichus sp. SB1 TaxID=1658109 RepID=UPI00067EF4C5|nr:PTS fructose transporter subunit EIIC [Candidatus Stoquefichus sp. SB1]